MSTPSGSPRWGVCRFLDFVARPPFLSKMRSSDRCRDDAEQRDADQHQRDIVAHLATEVVAAGSRGSTDPLPAAVPTQVPGSGLTCSEKGSVVLAGHAAQVTYGRNRPRQWLCRGRSRVPRGGRWDRVRRSIPRRRGPDFDSN